MMKLLKKYSVELVTLTIIYHFLQVWNVSSLHRIIFVLLLATIWCKYVKNPSRNQITQKDVILITGCDSGLGYSLATHCKMDLKLNVIACVRNVNSTGAKNLSEIGVSIQSVELKDQSSIKTLITNVNSFLKDNNFALKAVVNNAGAMIFGEFEWLTEEQIKHQVEVNLLGTMEVTRQFLPLLRQHLSRLIIVTSHCALEPLPGVAVYGATKAGLAAFTNSLRMEMKKYGVSVVNFIPGSFMPESNLLLNQKSHFKAMESAMTEEAKSFYSGYFERYAYYLSQFSNVKSPKVIEDCQLYETFADALLERYPQTVYKCEPWRYKFYHILMKFSPTPVHDWLVEKFVQMPK